MRRFTPIMLFAVMVLGACSTPEPTALPTIFDFPTDTPTPEAQVLEFWESAGGMLTAADSTAVWTFSAQEDDQITLRVIGRGNTPRLTLIDPSDNVLQQGDSLLAVLPQTGTYRVEVNANGTPGDYELGLGYVDAEVQITPLPQVVGVPTPPPALSDLGAFISELAPGATVGGTFTNDNLQHVYTFVGEVGQYVTVTLKRVSGEIDPRLTLYTPAGQPIAMDANSGENADALVRNVRLATDGIYSVQADGDGEGGYALQYFNNAQPDPVTPTYAVTLSTTWAAPAMTPTIGTPDPEAKLVDHVPVRGTFAASGDVIRYAFDVLQGEMITVGVSPAEGSPLIPKLELYDPDGVPVSAAVGNTSPIDREAIIAAYTAALTGPYTAYITAEGNTLGDYIISFGKGTTRQDAVRGAAAADRPHTGAITQRGLRDTWYANFNAGDVVSISVTPTDATLNPVLELVKADDGTLVGIDNSTGGARTPQINGMRIPQSGMYYLRVRPLLPDSLGGYTLLWRYVTLAPTSVPQVAYAPVLSIVDSVPDSVYQFYPFYGRANQRVLINVAALPETDFDGVAALLGVEGEVLTENDDNGDSSDPRIEFTLPVDGTYNVRVNGYLTGGDFELRVEEVFGEAAESTPPPSG